MSTDFVESQPDTIFIYYQDQLDIVLFLIIDLFQLGPFHTTFYNSCSLEEPKIQSTFKFIRR